MPNIGSKRSLPLTLSPPLQLYCSHSKIGGFHVWRQSCFHKTNSQYNQILTLRIRADIKHKWIKLREYNPEQNPLSHTHTERKVQGWQTQKGDGEGIETANLEKKRRPILHTLHRKKSMKRMKIKFFCLRSRKNGNSRSKAISKRYFSFYKNHVFNRNEMNPWKGECSVGVPGTA